MFTIHGVPLSIHVRKVIITALEKRLEPAIERMATCVRIGLPERACATVSAR